MPDPCTLAVFALASVVLLVMPGPSVLFVVARTLEHGRSAGLVTVLGVEAGALTHALAAAAGLSALLAASAPACTALRLAGAGYLLWLAAAALRAAASDPSTRRAPGQPATSRARLFVQAALVDLTNVKTALFFIAFLPAFVDPARGSVGEQFALLGACFVSLAFVVDGAYALVAAHLVGRLRDGRRLACCGAVTYLGLAALTLYPLVATTAV